jgi:hypothetical protein
MTVTPSDPDRRDLSTEGFDPTAPGERFSTSGTDPTADLTRDPVGGPTGDLNEGEASTGGSGTARAARREAGLVGEAAGGAVKDVTSTTKVQGERVVSDVRQQVRRLTDETRSQMTEQATSQRDRAVDGLRSLSDELGTMAERSDQSGVASDLARQGSDAARRASEYLAKREPGQLLEEVRGLARRRPGAFLLGAAALGVVAGRLSRGMIDSRRGDGDAGTRRPLGSRPPEADPFSTHASGTPGTQSPGMEPSSTQSPGPKPSPTQSHGAAGM